VLLLSCMAAYAQASGHDPHALTTARAAMQRHDYPRAIQVLQTELALDPGNLEVKSELGKAYLYSGNDDRASAIFEEVLQKDPQNHTANLETARLLGYHRQYDASNTRYRTMLAGNPNDAQASAGLVRNLMHQKRYGEARRELA